MKPHEVIRMTPQEATKHLTSIVNEIDDWRCDLGQVANEKEMNQIRAIWLAIEGLQFQHSIVKCKDCLNRKRGTAWCMAHNYVVMDDDYCSRGERRCEE